MSAWGAVARLYNSDWGGPYTTASNGNIVMRPQSYGRTRPVRYPKRGLQLYKRRGGAYRRTFKRRRFVKNLPRRNGAFARNGNANLSALAALPQKAFDAEFTLPAGTSMHTPTTGAVLGGAPHDGLPLVNIGIGTGEGQRLGKDIVVHSMLISGGITFSPPNPIIGQGISTDDCVLYVVIDKQCNGTVASGPTIWAKSNTFGSGGGYNPDNPGSLLRNLDNTDRFQVVAKKRWHFSTSAYSANVPAYAQQFRPVELMLKFGDLKIDYLQTDAVGSIAGFRSNQLLMFWASTNGFCLMSGFTRVRYTSL